MSFGTLGILSQDKPNQGHLWPISRLEFGGCAWQWIVSKISIERDTIYSYYHSYTFNTSVNMSLLLNTLAEMLKVRLLVLVLGPPRGSGALSSQYIVVFR